MAKSLVAQIAEVLAGAHVLGKDSLAPVYVNQPAIEYQMDAQGGFYAADTYRKVIEYAYPSSIHALQAVKNPAKVADETLAGPAIRYADRWEYMRGKMLRAKEEKSTCE